MCRKFLFVCLIFSWINAEAQSSFKIQFATSDTIKYDQVEVAKCNDCTKEKVSFNTFQISTNGNFPSFIEIKIIGDLTEEIYTISPKNDSTEIITPKNSLLFPDIPPIDSSSNIDTVPETQQINDSQDRTESNEDSTATEDSTQIPDDIKQEKRDLAESISALENLEQARILLEEIDTIVGRVNILALRLENDDLLPSKRSELRDSLKNELEILEGKIKEVQRKVGDAKERVDKLLSQLREQRDLLLFKNYYIYFVSFLFIIAAVVVVFFLRQNRKINEKNEKLELQAKEIVEKNEKLELQAKEIVEKNEKSELQAKEIAEKNEKLVAKNEELEKSEQELIDKNELLNIRTSELESVRVLLQRGKRDQEEKAAKIEKRFETVIQNIIEILKLQSNVLSKNKTPVLLPIQPDFVNSIKYRVDSLNHIYKLIVDQNSNEIDLKRYVGGLMTYLEDAFQLKNILNYEILSDLRLNVNLAENLGIIISEMVFNIYRHAYRVKKSEEFWIKFEENELNELVLEIKDNGDGLPQDFNYEIKKNDSLGFMIVSKSLEKIEGKLDVKKNEEPGACFVITFELKKRL